MECFPEASLVSAIFPKNSSVLLCAPSKSGKTSFVHRLLLNRQLYFGDNKFDKVLIVSCNPQVDIVLPETDYCSIEGIYLEEFDSSQVESGTCLIFDDVSNFSNKISEILNVSLHHLNLPFVAVCVHSVLGSDLFRLASICHRIIFFLQSTSSARSAAFLISRFFRDRETKVYLEQVLAFCQRDGTNLLVCLNKSADETCNFLALSHLEKLVSGYCLAYPATNFQIAPDSSERMEVADKLAKNFDLKNIPPNTLVLVPADLVLRAKKNLPTSDSDHSCTKIWNKGVKEIESAIESYFKVVHWSRCKNLLREILKNSEFCLDPETLILYLKKSHRQKANLIDFLAFATRPSGPLETPKPESIIFKKFATALLNKGSPRNLFKNKFLL